MLISDSQPLLWLTYLGLSLVVLVTGYLAIGFMARLPRLVVTGLVAGALLTPCMFSIPGPEEQLGYSGWAPALIVFVVGILQHDGGQVSGAGLVMVIGMVAGLGLALLLARRVGSSRSNDDDNDTPAKRRATGTAEARREPTVRQT
ncbi:hypothetical protein [Larsenimonas rhizosphaerae]|uniref:Uncharacterized protein n=1 Tax=Larsenimonas rhizosphaerae TaxID=2944682 RepID=A0AA42CV30_9GAMM|nr:hypothetical protein [Larsenimonas rhizosphaerae]MCM2131998.1 hypothetical protein [Larsenimonas rhizosphaerae]MCX2524601.1 hypothetical protein [Larsenimonas rhizosphaerae]